MAEVGSKSALSAAAQAAAKINALLAAKGKLPKPATPPPVPLDFTCSKEIEINDVPNPQRYSLTKTSFHEELVKDHDASIAVRGRYFQPEEKEELLKKNPDLTKLDTNERPLYLLVQAKSALDLDRVVGRITVIIQEAVLRRTQPPAVLTQPISHANPPSTRPIHYVQEKVFVGIESEEGFDVKEKLLGPGGTYLAHIVRDTNARLQLRGRGSGYIEPTSGKEAFEQLYIHASHATHDGLNRAVALCRDLVASVQRQYDDFQRAKAAAAYAHHAAWAYTPYGAAPPYGAPYAAPPPAPYGAPYAAPPTDPYASAPPPAAAPYTGPPPVAAPYTGPPLAAAPYTGPPPAAPAGAPFAAVPPPPPGVTPYMAGPSPSAPTPYPAGPPPLPAAPPAPAPAQAPVSHVSSQPPADDTKPKKRRFIERAPSPPKRTKVEDAPAPAPAPPEPEPPKPTFAVPAPPKPKPQSAEQNGTSDAFKMPAPIKKKAAKAPPQSGGLVDYGDDSDENSD